jgi:hypothetical protein
VTPRSHILAAREGDPGDLLVANTDTEHAILLGRPDGDQLGVQPLTDKVATAVVVDLSVSLNFAHDFAIIMFNWRQFAWEAACTGPITGDGRLLA